MANSFFDYRKNSCLNDSIDTALDAISQTISSLDDIESIEPNELTCLLFNKILQSVRYIKSAEELGFLSRNQLSHWKHIESRSVIDYRKNSCLNDSIDTALDAISKATDLLDDIESVELNEMLFLLFNKILQYVRYIKSAKELGFLSQSQLDYWKSIENKAVFVTNFIEDFYHLKNVYPFTDNFVFYMKNRELMNEFFKELIRVTKNLTPKHKESI